MSVSDPWRRIVKWGQPWHGPIVGGNLTLPTGATIPVDLGTSFYTGDTWYQKRTGQPTPITREDEALDGLQWTNDAILFGLDKRYSPKAPNTIGDGWIYYAPSGKRWRIAVTIALAGTTGDKAPGDECRWTVTVTAYPFGDIGGTDSTPRELYSAIISANTPSATPPEGLNYLLCATTFPDARRDVYHSPDGSAAFVNLMVGTRDDATITPYLPKLALRVLRVDVFESSGNPYVSVSTDGSPATAWEQSRVLVDTVLTPFYRHVHLFVAETGTFDNPADPYQREYLLSSEVDPDVFFFSGESNTVTESGRMFVGFDAAGDRQEMRAVISTRTWVPPAAAVVDVVPGSYLIDQTGYSPSVLTHSASGYHYCEITIENRVSRKRAITRNGVEVASNEFLRIYTTFESVLYDFAGPEAAGLQIVPFNRENIDLHFSGYTSHAATIDGIALPTVGPADAPSIQSDFLRLTNNVWTIRAQHVLDTTDRVLTWLVSLGGQQSISVPVVGSDPGWASWNPRTGAFLQSLVGPVGWV